MKYKNFKRWANLAQPLRCISPVFFLKKLFEVKLVFKIVIKA
jgi:hypothetical protein